MILLEIWDCVYWINGIAVGPSTMYLDIVLRIHVSFSRNTNWGFLPLEIARYTITHWISCPSLRFRFPSWSHWILSRHHLLSLGQWQDETRWITLPAKRPDECWSLIIYFFGELKWIWLYILVFQVILLFYVL